MHFWRFPPQLHVGLRDDSLQPSGLRSRLDDAKNPLNGPRPIAGEFVSGTIWKGRGMQLFYVRHTTAYKRRQEYVNHGGVTGYVSVQIAVQITHTPLHRKLAILASGAELDDDLRLIGGGLEGGDDLQGARHGALQRREYPAPSTCIVRKNARDAKVHQPEAPESSSTQTSMPGTRTHCRRPSIVL